MFWRRKRNPSPEFLAFGLGNPGVRYMRSRHNIGWWVLDELARRHGVEVNTHRHKGQVDFATICGISVALIKPTTFMNRSGQCVAAWHREFPDARFTVVYDDISMDTGKLRIRGEGSAGGNNGVKSIIDALQTAQFNRVKIGVGSPGPTDAAEYVLEQPSAHEIELIQPAVSGAADVIELMIAGDDTAARDVIARLAQTQPEADSPDQGK